MSHWYGHVGHTLHRQLAVLGYRAGYIGGGSVWNMLQALPPRLVTGTPLLQQDPPARAKRSIYARQQFNFTNKDDQDVPRLLSSAICRSDRQVIRTIRTKQHLAP
jgi:hypothetical protein